ncbi:translation initiation factor IF-2 [Striga asiatica]|uniref:Translation initiation factor IF-2 n=1 Tax=Striga asiatica TaxID=4170 RepID=A0A5A7PDU7_STRAF|nr:translation initiation factor IF-2 [Striga asiatica]
MCQTLTAAPHPQKFPQEIDENPSRRIHSSPQHNLKPTPPPNSASSSHASASLSSPLTQTSTPATSNFSSTSRTASNTPSSRSSIAMSQGLEKKLDQEDWGISSSISPIA